MSKRSFLNTRFYAHHADLLCQSYERYVGKPLVTCESESTACVDRLFEAPFALVSHGTEADPIFNFGNQIALELFELAWDQFTMLPSRQSAEPINREERQRLLDQVTQQGYMADYSGVRISATGKRFLIKQAVVWNLMDSSGLYQGQAAAFDQWDFL